MNAEIYSPNPEIRKVRVGTPTIPNIEASNLILLFLSLTASRKLEEFSQCGGV